MNKTIGLVGITGCRNRGVEALLDTTIVEMRKLAPELNFVIFTENKQFDESALARHAKVEFIASRPFQLASRSSLKRFIGAELMRRDDFRQLKVLKRRIKEMDLVVATGGDIYSTDYGTVFLKRQLAPIELAQENGIPVVYLGQSITRYRDPNAANLWVRTAKRAKAVLLRDNISYRYAVDELGLDAPSVERVADPSFVMQPVGGSVRAGLLKSYNLDSRRYLVVSPSAGITRFGSVSETAHQHAWLRFIDQLSKTAETRIAMVPHVQEERVWEDDRRLCSEIQRQLQYPENVTLVGGDHNALELKAIIGGAEAVFAERMHSAMAGLSQAVPTFVVGYSVKGKGILSDLLRDEATVEQCIISVKEFTESGVNHDKLHRFLSNRSEISAQLSEALPQYKKLATRSFIRIKECLE